MENQINATVIDHMGGDINIVNAARVTMGIERKGDLKENDEKLINFLAREQHKTPFRHATVTLRCRAPIAISRQLGKHQVGFSWNEMSRRYKDGKVEVFIPETIFHRPSDLHEGSGTKLEGFEKQVMSDLIKSTYDNAIKSYEKLLKLGVAPEQARFVLPQGMITEWIWTGSLYGWFDLYRQRSSDHAQYEVRLFAEEVNRELSKLFPVAWKALKDTIK